ncbi:MAG: hypothetical protein ABUL41_00320 [Chitinophagaceae bacterium]
MKKVIVSILAFLYISTSTGATIHLHYCMGKFVSWKLGHKLSDRCGKCGMKINHKSLDNGCCKDEFRPIKNDKDQKLSTEPLFLVQPVCLLTPGFQSELFSFVASSVFETFPVSNAPPRSPDAIYIRNCLFLI